MDDASGERPVRATIVVSGLVQGVGYRAFTLQVAARKRLSGGVRNLDDGRVEIEVEGHRSVIEALISELRIGPSGARVERVDLRWSEASGTFHDFHVWY